MSATLFQLIQYRAAIRLEAVGMKHSSGRSARKAACLELGLPVRSDSMVVLIQLKAEIERRMDAIKKCEETLKENMT